jgi:hypothetical protein
MRKIIPLVFIFYSICTLAQSITSEEQGYIDNLKVSTIDGEQYFGPNYDEFNCGNEIILSICFLRNDLMYLFFEVSYTKSKEINFNKVYFLYDNKKVNITEGVECQKDGGYISKNEFFELLAISPTPDSIISTLKEMLKSKEVKIILSGYFTETRKLSNKEMEDIRYVLNSYEIFKKKGIKEWKGFIEYMLPNGKEKGK